MGTTTNHGASRREFLHESGRLLGASALAMAAVPAVHAAENNTIQAALIGRGTGAAVNCLSVQSGPMKLVAMADVFAGRLGPSYDSLNKDFAAQVDAPPERRFLGFDAYRKAMDCLRPGDVAILGTPPAFRWVHFAYAIEKGLHVFMEKPIAVDGPSAEDDGPGGKIAAAEPQGGRRPDVPALPRTAQLFERIRDGQIGDLIALRAYRMHGPLGFFASSPRPAGFNELLFQVQRFHSFLWAGGGAFSDFYIHHIDECCWMKNAWPVRAQATGGRHYRGDSIDQNFDNYSVEYTFGDGAKLFLYGRCMDGCHEEFASYAHGAKGSALISAGGHFPARCKLVKGQDLDAPAFWKVRGGQPNPYQTEWDDFVEAIRQDKPYNEIQRGAEASLATFMGRLAAHTGGIVTWDEALAHEHELGPGLDKLTADSPPPLAVLPNGKYPVPQPGLTGRREF